MATRLKGCGRGVFGLSSWDTAPASKPQHNGATEGLNQQSTIVEKGKASQTAKKTKDPPSEIPKPGQTIYAKYNYKANPASPIGRELDLRQGTKLKFLAVSATNAHWWQAKIDGPESDEGYVPANYMHIVKMEGLPWLNNREPEEEEDDSPKPAYKPYQPTYDKKGIARGTDKYHCEVCEKFFNGPAPYKMHMNSKAHKEELELQESYKDS